MKKLLIIICLLLLSGCTKLPEVGGGATNIIADNLKLKVSKDKILESRNINWKVKNLDGSFKNKGLIKSYDYITDKKVDGKFIFHGKFSGRKIVEEKGNEITEFNYGCDEFYKDVNGDIYEIEHGATTTIEAFNEQTKITLLNKIKQFFGRKALATDYYSSGGNGWVGGYNSVSPWATLRAANGNYAVAAPTEDWVIDIYTTGSGNITNIIRGLFSADTSGAGTITAASLNVYVTNHTNTFPETSYLRIATGTLGNTASISEADYQNNVNNNTAVATDVETVGGLTNSQYNSIPLTNLEAINKTGFTVLVLKSKFDADNSPPTLTNSARQDIQIRFSGYTGTNYDPYLSVTYTLPSTALPDDGPIIFN